jgi:hypothetical protein
MLCCFKNLFCFLIFNSMLFSCAWQRHVKQKCIYLSNKNVSYANKKVEIDKYINRYQQLSGLYKKYILVQLHFDKHITILLLDIWIMLDLVETFLTVLPHAWKGSIFLMKILFNISSLSARMLLLELIFHEFCVRLFGMFDTVVVNHEKSNKLTY